MSWWNRRNRKRRSRGERTWSWNCALPTRVPGVRFEARFVAAWKQPDRDEVAAVVPGAATSPTPEVPHAVTVRIAVWRTSAAITRRCVPTDVEHIADLLRQRLFPEQRLDQVRGLRFRLLDVRLTMKPKHRALLAQHVTAQREHALEPPGMRTTGGRAADVRQDQDPPFDSPDTGVDTHDQLLQETVALLRGLDVEEKRTALAQVPVLLKTLGLSSRSERRPPS